MSQVIRIPYEIILDGKKTDALVEPIFDYLTTDEGFQALVRNSMVYIEKSDKYINKDSNASWDIAVFEDIVGYLNVFGIEDKYIIVVPFNMHQGYDLSTLRIGGIIAEPAKSEKDKPKVSKLHFIIDPIKESKK